MKDADALEAIEGAEKVVALFGRWPSFHDAEVVRLVFATTTEGFSATLVLVAPWFGAELRVEFSFEECDAPPGTELAGFAGQNVLFEIGWRLDGSERIVAELDPIASDVGVAGRIRCRRVRVVEATRVAES